MRWIVYAVSAIVLLGIVVTVIGAMLPKAHSASRTARIAMPPDALHALILKRIGEPQEYPLRVERNEPPSLVITRIAGERLPFGGTWTYRIAPVPGGSELTITEDGEVYNPIFRFMSRFVFGHYATMDAFIGKLQ
ncbi:MAG TPA: hypothetical protein VH138_18885 [Vicinamibacterales bacterium]|jgi:hypothetical protein|nr:hypothetical protein [Vicinamibacterales bacterium]